MFVAKLEFALFKTEKVRYIGSDFRLHDCILQRQALPSFYLFWGISLENLEVDKQVETRIIPSVFRRFTPLALRVIYMHPSR